jgi:RHS repeat-associated protein
MTENNYSSTFNYDTWGNKATSNVGSANDPTTPSAYDSSTNRISSPINPWTDYDLHGNQKKYGAYTLWHNGDDLLRSATMHSGSVTNEFVRYEYDGEGRRVRKLTCSQPSTTCTDSTQGVVITVYIYDASGKLMAERSTPGVTNSREYNTTDALGSIRLVTDASGNVKRRYDYPPFGEEIPQYTNGRSDQYPFASGSADGQSQKFTGKERDQETGLDYFGARYYSGAQGRFTTPDWSENLDPIPYADLKDPQSLNLYAYVRNNPLTNRDLDGHWCIFGIGNTCNQNPATTAAQGSSTGTGAQLLNDGIRRGQYEQAASQLSGSGASAARKALQGETYNQLSPIGKGLTNAAKAARAGQLAGKTAEQLAESASRTSGTWNAIGSASKVFGAAGVVVGVGIAASNIVSAPEGQKGKVAAGEAGAFAGGLGGGSSGAWIGGIIGSLVEPGGGTAAGAIIGDLIGGGGGAVAGQKAGTEIYKKLEDQ